MSSQSMTYVSKYSPDTYLSKEYVPANATTHINTNKIITINLFIFVYIILETKKRNPLEVPFCFMLTTDYEAETVNQVVPPLKDTFKAPPSTFNVAPEAPPIVNVPANTSLPDQSNVLTFERFIVVVPLPTIST